MTALDIIKDQLKNAHELFTNTSSDIKTEHLHKDPGGKAFPLVATYAHLVFSEDTIVQAMMQGKSPLFSSTYKDNTGASAPMPPMDENWDIANDAWSRTVKIDFPKMQEYTKAVFAATTEYVNSLTKEDLEREIDLGAWGKQSVAKLLSNFIIGHALSLAGEISALKGVQGEKGYQF